MAPSSLRVRLIRLTLLEGDPDGLRTVAIAGSTTVVTCCPLSRLSALKERDEATRPAVYFLSGESDGSDAIYIGECDSLADRFRGKHHAMDKAEWRQIAVAFTTDETFNKAHARRAEHLLVDTARALRRAKVFTDQTSPGKLSDGDAAFTRDFVNDVALLAEILGIRVFRGRQSEAPHERAAAPLPRPKPAESRVVPEESRSNLVGDTFRFTGARDIAARMRADGAGFLVLSGSEMRKGVLSACPPSALNVCNRVMEGRLAEQIPEKPDHLRLTADVPTTSTSTAAGLLTGTSLRGPHVWEHEGTGLRYDRWLESVQRIEGSADG